MTIDKNFTGTGRHRRKRTDSGPATGSFIPGDLNGVYTGHLLLPNHNETKESRAPIILENPTDDHPEISEPVTDPNLLHVSDEPIVELPAETVLKAEFDAESTKHPTDQIMVVPDASSEIKELLPPDSTPTSDEENFSHTDQLLIVTSHNPSINDIHVPPTSLEDFLDGPLEPDDHPSPLSETGRHRIIQQNTKRGIAAWPIVTAIFVILVVVSLIAWKLVSNHLNNRRIHELALCPEVKESVIYASPILANPLGKLVKAFNATHPRQGDYCYTFSLNVLDSHVALNYLASPRISSAKPILWIPESSLYTAALKAKNPKLNFGQAVSIASSPVVLAVQPLNGNPLAKLKWSDLPAAQKPEGLTPFNVTSWYSLKLALPRGYNFVATDLVTAAIAAGESHHLSTILPALNPQVMLRNRLDPRIFDSIHSLFSAAPKLRVYPYDSWQILNLLAHQDPEKVNELHAVPVLEQQLFQYVARYPNARLTELIPNDFPIVADFPAQVIANSNTDQEALSSFIDYALKNATFRQEIARLGLRDPQYIQHFAGSLGLSNTILNLGPITSPVFPSASDPRASNAILQAIQYS